MEDEPPLQQSTSTAQPRLSHGQQEWLGVRKEAECVKTDRQPSSRNGFSEKKTLPFSKSALHLDCFCICLLNRGLGRK